MHKDLTGFLVSYNPLCLWAQMAVSVSESVAIMSMALSPDNAWILVNLSSHTIHLWPMEPMLRQLDALHSGQISPGVHPAA